LLVLNATEESEMAFGEMWIELAGQRADYLRDEGRRVARHRRTQPADGRKTSVGPARAARLVHWLQHGQLGRGIALSDAPVTARGRCL
jgi:hypothetical protein